MTYSKKLFACALAAIGCAAVVNALTKPNVLIIYTDDQGYGDVSYLNPDSKFQTPNMDRIAEEGINFTHGHSGGTACTPSRYSLLTGRYAWRTHLKRSVGSYDESSLIAEDRLTMGDMLRGEGYNTACVGKWHLGMDLPGTRGARDWSQPILDGPLDRGFDYWYGIPVSPKMVCAWFENRGLAPGAAEPNLWTYHKKNLPSIDRRWRVMSPYYSDPKDQPVEEIQNKKMLNEVAPDWEDDQLLERYTDKAIEWMKGKEADVAAGKPFFMYFSMTSPHEPVAPRKEFLGKSECAGYGDFCMETDYEIGRLLDYLDDSGLAENTLVLFSSDNGPEGPWKERLKEFGHRSSGPLRDGKRSHYEGGHRVPFFVRWPAGIKQPGREWSQPVHQPDFMATLADILGIEIPDTAAEDSQSFKEVFENPQAQFEHLPIIAMNNRNGQMAITDGKWKWVTPAGKKKAELYDLSEDVEETKNLIKQQPEVAERLEATLTQIVTSGRSTPGARQTNDTGWWPELTWLSADKYKALHSEVEPATVGKRKKQDSGKKKGNQGQ